MMVLTTAKLLMQFGFMFLLTYFIILICFRITSRKWQALAGGVMMGLQIILISYLQELLQWQNLADGRYFFAAFAVYFWGPIALVPFTLGVLSVSFLHPNIYIAQNIITMVMVSLPAYFFRQWVQEKELTLKWYHLLVMSIVPLAIALPLANLFYGTEEAVAEANSSVLLILFSYILLNYAIVFANSREIDRQKKTAQLLDANKELAEQNLEIRALYEEMAASEEALQESYSELNDYKDKLEHLAYHDSKTGLYNRDFLQMQLEAITGQTLENRALVYIRIHNFEHITETLGQSLSEILHVIVSKQLEEASRNIETFTLYHLDTGRFAIEISNYHEDILQYYLKEIIAHLSATQLVENMILPIELDLGAVMVDQEKPDAVMFAEYVEIAMLESAKQLKRNQLVWFSKKMYQSKQYQTRIEFDLQRAIDDHQFFVVLQPQYTKERHIIGAEVLLRWKHPEFGMISPMIFIPLAERMGLINSIGQVVFKQTLDIATKIKTLVHSTLPLSINTSLIELVDIHFSTYINESLLERQLDKHLIHIEITESALIKDMSHIQANLDNLIDLGISIHLDDFGTGYSSLSHLSQLPVSFIKIDKSFIDNLQKNQKDLSVVQTIIELGHRLNMKIIAEGVESTEQVDILDSLGCDYYQGYYFSKPITQPDFYAMLKGN